MQAPFQQPSPPLQQPPYQPTLQDKIAGKRFNRAVMITILFLVLSNSYKIAENIYYMFTSQTGEIFNLELEKPTMKGYVVMSLIFFVVVFFIS